MIGIFKKPGDEKSEAVFNNFIKELEKQSLEFKSVGKDFGADLSLLVVIGGDGTVLSVAKRAADFSLHVLGINAGNVGFLSAFEAHETEACAYSLKNGLTEVEKRAMLKAECNGKVCYALNEVSVQRENSDGMGGCTLPVSLKIDDEVCDSFRGDGMIIATPTGSTAYSLSAGGAVLSPDLNAFIATPVCAHSLTSKPVVFSSERTAEISLSDGYAGSVYCDGRFFSEIDGKSPLIVTKSDKYTLLIKSKRGFFKTLRVKLGG